MSSNGRTQVAPLDLVAYGLGNFATGAAMQTLGTYLAFMPFSVLAGSGIGAFFTLPLAMVADTVDLDEAAVQANRARIRALRGGGV